MMGRTILPINWLQIMENSLDPVHTEWLHGHHYEFAGQQGDGGQGLAHRQNQGVFQVQALSLQKLGRYRYRCSHGHALIC
jgi:phenylpropionate dioxygenase-like ring-hydroxylating dioxygenase large terminal subunit